MHEEGEKLDFSRFCEINPFMRGVCVCVAPVDMAFRFHYPVVNEESGGEWAF